MYEITDSELVNFTDRHFAEKACFGERQYSIYYADRTTIALIGRSGKEFVAGLTDVLEKGAEAFARDDANKWCTGTHVAFLLWFYKNGLRVLWLGWLILIGPSKSKGKGVEMWLLVPIQLI